MPRAPTLPSSCAKGALRACTKYAHVWRAHALSRCVRPWGCARTARMAGLLQLCAPCTHHNCRRAQPSHHCALQVLALPMRSPRHDVMPGGRLPDDGRHPPPTAAESPHMSAFVRGALLRPCMSCIWAWPTPLACAHTLTTESVTTPAGRIFSVAAQTHEHRRWVCGQRKHPWL